MRPSTRRTFIRHTGYGAAALAVASTLSSRLRAAPATSAYLKSTDTTQDPLFMSATKLAELIRTKKLSAVEAVKINLARIERVNPKINAVVALCAERALTEAAAADAALAQGTLLGPLHGVPMTIKDSFDTQGVVSTAGTLGRKHYIPGTDATVVARLRAAGAILIGKSNTPEFTLGGGGKGTVNLVYGLTKNPYNIQYQPSGSSGGAGAIVAAGGAPFDIGSDYGGSIRGPAYANGIAGIKPTYGTVPRTGHIVDYGGPFDSWQEIGPLTRKVEDLALIMPLICGPDDWDCAMIPIPFGNPATVELPKLRVAFYTSDGVDPTPEIQAMVKSCAAMFEALGCTVTEAQPPRALELAELRNTYRNANGRDHLRRKLVKWGTQQASPGLPLSGEILPSAEFTRLCEEIDSIKSQQLAWFEAFDLIVCPVSETGAVPLDNERRPGELRSSYRSNYNVNGWPAGVVRAATSSIDVMPLGVQIVAHPFRDDVVVAALAHVESQTGGYQRPIL